MVIVASLWAASVVWASPPSTSEEVRPLRVLLLGGSAGSHRPELLARFLTQSLAPAIAVVYTEDVTTLTPDRLRGTDVVAIYRDHGELPAAQETALIEAVDSGKGLFVLHCGSHCFRNSGRYTALIGGRFARHGRSLFPVTIVDAQHPSMKDLGGFAVDDETYTHNELGDDIHVLMVREEAGGFEPSAWYRWQGRGRVFYTALGHDEKTWHARAFIPLVRQGLLWSSGRIPDAPTAENPKDPRPAPLSPAESMKRAHLPEGLELRLFAAEPDIIKPIAMAFDERGRLFVAESIDYPNDVRPKGTGRDRIRVCEDTNADGVADKFSLFADQLNIPTSLLPFSGGVLVAAPPDILFLKDTDGDGRADQRKVLYSGFHRSDTHAVLGNFRYGLDNWIWATIGYSGATVRVGKEELRFGAGLFRFRPDGSALEVMTATQSNTWGLGFNEEGDVFLSKANDEHSLHFGLANRVYESVRGWHGVGNRLIADHQRMHPIPETIRQWDWHGKYTAAAGQTIYTARALPKVYWNRAAFVCEPTGHLVHTDLLTPKGSSFVARDGYNLFASSDPWCAPIEAIVGPDGAVWMLDWYNYIIQHNPTPAGFRTGVGNAYVTPDRDKEHGRIYRIVPKGLAPSKAIDPGALTSSELVDWLRKDNQWHRHTAQRLLVERKDRAVVPELWQLVDQDRAGLAAMHALATLDGIQPVGESENSRLRAACDHPSAAVRRMALRLLPKTERNSDRIRDRLENDSDPKVLMAALLATAEMPPSADLARSVADVLSRNESNTDAWLGSAGIAAAARHDLAFLLDVAQQERPKEEAQRLAPAVRVVAVHFARGAPVHQVEALLAALGTAPEPVAHEIVAGLSAGWPANQPPKPSARLVELLSGAIEKLPREGVGLYALARRWGMAGEMTRAADRLRADFEKKLTASTVPEAERRQAAEQLAAIALTPETVNQILDAIGPRSSPEFAMAMLELVSQANIAEVAPAILDRWQRWTPSLQAEACNLLLTRPGWTDAMLTAIEKGAIAPSELAVDQWQRLRDYPDRRLATRAARILNTKGQATSPDRQAIVKQLLPLASQKGDYAVGKAAFEKNCAKCHRNGGIGNVVGPDLTGMAARRREDILTEILDPNRSVEGNYRQYTVVSTDGRLLTGLLASESKTAIEMLDAEGKRQTILREDIESLIPTNRSLMPEGFEKLAPEELTGILEFLSARTRYIPLSLRGAATLATTRGMFYDRKNDVERLIFSTWGAKEFSGIPFQVADPANGRIPNAVVLYSPNGLVTQSLPRTARVPCNLPAKAIHLLGGVSGWGYPLGQKGSLTMTVVLHYADGSAEKHPLYNGVHFADYIRRIEVPGSQFAFALRQQQLRYLAVIPKRNATISEIEFEKGPDSTAPVIMAVTVESP